MPALSSSNLAFDNNTTMDKAKEVRLSHPILQIIEIDSNADGNITIINGNISINKKDLYSFNKASIGEIVAIGDILQLNEGASVRVTYKDGSHIDLEAPGQVKWFKFEKSDQKQ